MTTEDTIKESEEPKCVKKSLENLPDVVQFAESVSVGKNQHCLTACCPCSCKEGDTTFNFTEKGLIKLLEQQQAEFLKLLDKIPCYNIGADVLYVEKYEEIVSRHKGYNECADKVWKAINKIKSNLTEL